MSAALNIYNKLPDTAKDLLKHVYSLIPLQARLGKRFFEQLEFLEKSQWWSGSELENYQNEELRKLIHHAYENVPYYNRLFRAHRLSPADIRTKDDLPKIPIVTKDAMRENADDFRATNFKDRDVVKLNTSGTTGRPLIFYYDRQKEYLDFDPYIWRFFGWGGHKVGQRHATLSSWTIGKDSFSYNPVRNLLILSAYNLNAQNAHEYADALRTYKVEYLDGYPSSIEFLVSFLKARHIERPIALKAIFCHSEYLSDWQRNAIEAYWGCRCFNWYGLEERVVLGTECDRHEGMHLCPDFGITEFINKKIITTSLTNYAMPFIRYDTEDAGELTGEKCSCGRNFPLFTLAGGRKRSFAIGKDGSLISVTNIDIPNVSENVWQFQFVQKEKGSLLLQIVRKESFGEGDMARIRRKIEEKFGQNMDVGISFVERIRQAENKKTPIFIQEMKDIAENGIPKETESALL